MGSIAAGVVAAVAQATMTVVRHGNNFEALGAGLSLITIPITFGIEWKDRTLTAALRQLARENPRN